MVGAGILALWVDFRLGKRSPQSLKMVIVNGGGAMLAMEVVSRLGGRIILEGSMPLTMLALFLIVLPGFTYAFLASLWFLKLVRSVIPR